MKCTKLLSQASTDIFGSLDFTKLVMGKMCDIACKISKPSTDYYVVPLHKWPHDFVVMDSCRDG